MTKWLIFWGYNCTELSTASLPKIPLVIIIKFGKHKAVTMRLELW